MHPVANAPVWHFFLETLGIFLGFQLYLRLRVQEGDSLSDGRRYQLLIAACLGALLGSRLLGALEDPGLFWSGGGAVGLSYYLRAKTIVGGLLGGLWATELTKWAYGEQRRSGDLLVFPLIIAMVVGRIGCFLMGVQEPTHGLPTEEWYGLDLGDGQLRHATALYEIVFLLVLGGALWWRRRKIRQVDGLLFMLFLATYLCYRFLVGFIQPSIETWGLGVLQWASLLGLGWYSWEFYQLSRKAI